MDSCLSFYYFLCWSLCRLPFFDLYVWLSF